MNGMKKPWQSTGVIGAMATILTAGLAMYGVQLTPETKPVVAALAVIIGTGFMALVGRVKATSAIGIASTVVPMAASTIEKVLVGEHGPETTSTSTPTASALGPDKLAEALASLATAVQGLAPAPADTAAPGKSAPDNNPVSAAPGGAQ
jgi:hypothetical protein